MLSRWCFTPDEVLVLWPYVGVSAFPFPVQIRSAAPTHEEQHYRDYQARARLESGGVLRGGRLDADLAAVLQTLAHPMLSCAAFGFLGPRSEPKVRVLGAHAGGVGVLAVQQPGASWDVGAELALSVVPAAELAGAVVGALPPAPAGRGTPIQVRTADLLAQTEVRVSVKVTTSKAERSAQQLAELTAGPLVGGGQFTVIAAQQRGAATVSSGLSWFDRPDDGRYLMARGDTTRVAAADFGTLVGELAQQLNHAVR